MEGGIKNLTLLFLFYIQIIGICLPVVQVSGDRIISDGPIVTVKQGRLQGAVIESSLEKQYIAFKGIPFAAPPLGALRFKDPEPPASWSGIRNASRYVADVCAQFDNFPLGKIIGDEDCLYLNVYTKSINETKPVMVWIHGGAFIFGSGADSSVKPDYLVEKDVLIVTINYRLGALGFLNLGHEVAAGNQGFKDQVAALQWVQDNIAVFGGDPNNVTIFGVSAGGVSVHALCMSRMAEGLFHKAISQSGVALHPWTLNRSKPNDSVEYAKILGCSSTDPVEIIEFLRTVPVHKLIGAQTHLIFINIGKHYYNLPFTLAVDTASKNPFFPQPIEQALTNDSRIPMIIGHTSLEFILFLNGFGESDLQELVDLLEDIVRGAVPNVHPSNISKLTEDLKRHYFGNNNNITAENVIKLLSDLFFVKDTNAVADNRRKRSSHAETYVYQFSYVGNEQTPTETILRGLSAIRGASHGDESLYLFYMPSRKVNNPAAPAVGTKDRIMIERMTEMWTNFAKTGNPTPSTDEFVKTIWKPATKDEFNYLDIDDDLKVKLIGKTIADIINKYT